MDVKYIHFKERMKLSKAKQSPLMPVSLWVVVFARCQNL